MYYNTLSSLDLERNNNSLWSPNSHCGFLFNKPPKQVSDLISSNVPMVSLVGSMSAYIDRLTDKEIESFINTIGNEDEITPTTFEDEEIEAIIRSYVIIAAHLIHRPYFVYRRELPATIARPLWYFSEYVGRPPSLTYASYALANFTNPLTHRMSASEIQIAQTPSCTPDEEWFVAVHLSAETAGGEVVQAINDIDEGLQEGDSAKIVKAIEAIESAMWFANEVMPTIKERMAPDVFRDKIRPLLYGHDKITFRGVPGEPTVTYVGETGAQSGMMRAADLALGTRHSESIQQSMGHFLVCAPPPHREFFKRAASIGRCLNSLTKDINVLKARRSALLAMAQFRRTHLNVVVDYLVPDGKRLSERGTGGTNFTDWLQRIIDETEADAVI